MAAMIVFVLMFVYLGRVAGNIIGCHDDEDCLALENPKLWRCVVDSNNSTGSLPCTIDAGLYSAARLLQPLHRCH